MPYSTVQRERLLPPLVLVEIGLGLILAFALLRPTDESLLRYDSPSPRSTQAAGIDELDLAYQRARQAAHLTPPEELRGLIANLLRNDRWDDAQALLEQSPENLLAGPAGLLLDLEYQAAGLNRSAQAAERASYEAALVQRLARLLEPGASADRDTLARAAAIADSAAQTQLAGGLYRRLAALDPGAGAQWWQSCGQAFNTGGRYAAAAECYREAMGRTHEPAARFETGLWLAENQAAAGDQVGVAATLESLAKEPSLLPADLERLARASLRAGHPEHAFPLFARLAEADMARRAHWLDEAATWAAAANQPGLAADYLDKAAGAANSSERAEIRARHQQMLTYAGRNDEALQLLAQRIEAAPDDTALLQEGVRLARATAQFDRAERWNRQLLAQTPRDVEALALQVDLAIAQKQVEAARDWAARWVEVQPDDPAARTKLAQLEEWSGHPDRALTQWQWLAQHQPSLEAERQLVRVAELNWQPEIAAAALRRSARHQPLNTEETLRLVKLYEMYGNSQGALEALEEMDKRHPDNPAYRREIAALHQRANQFEAALAAWERYAERFGRSAEETLNRAELHWRLRQPERALKVVESWNGALKGEASTYQLKLLAELGWRYRKPALVQAAVPQISAAFNESEKLHYGQRMVKSWVDAKEPQRAVEEAASVWRKTSDPAYLFRAIELARQNNLPRQAQTLLADAERKPELRKEKGYWMLRAEQALAAGNQAEAAGAYREILALDGRDEAALDGLLWTLMTTGDQAALSATLDQHRGTLTDLPPLWATTAMAELNLGRAQAAVPWFEKTLATGSEPDYAVLLAYADALEKTGNADRAYRARTYALKQMRPRAVAELQHPGKLKDIVRDYAALAQRFAGAEHNEALSRKLLASGDEATRAQREEVAVSWLLSTQRFGQAKLLLAEQHARRTQLPDWQKIVVALHENDKPTLDNLLKHGKGLTAGDRVLALEKLGREAEALALAEETVNEDAAPIDREIARNQAMHLKQQRPSHAGGELERRTIGALDVEHAGASVRHTFEGSDFGIAVQYGRNRLASDTYDLRGRNLEDDLALGLHYGNQRHGGHVTVGTNQRDDAVLNYLLGGYYHRTENGRQEFRANLDLNALADNGAALRAGAQRDRLQLAFRTLLGQREYAQITTDGHRYATRDGETIAEGFGATLEVGLLGAVGSNTWQLSAIAQTERNDRIAIPATLRAIIGPDAGFDSVIAERYTSLAFGAGLMRGGIKSDFPLTSAPRYHLRMQLARSWPGNDIGLQLDAGAGVRVLGSDELGFRFVYDQALGILAGDTESQSTVGVHYRNYF